MITRDLPIHILDRRPPMYLAGTPRPTPELDKTHRVIWLSPEAAAKKPGCVLCELGVPIRKNPATRT